MIFGTKGLVDTIEEGGKKIVRTQRTRKFAVRLCLLEIAGKIQP